MGNYDIEPRGTNADGCPDFHAIEQPGIGRYLTMSQARRMASIASGRHKDSPLIRLDLELAWIRGYRKPAKAKKRKNGRKVALSNPRQSPLSRDDVIEASK
jgi:hypothetical protein